MPKYDGRYKVLLKTFFQEFVTLFLPGLAKNIDFDSPTQFVEKDVITSITLGSRHEVDLLVQVKYQGRNAFFLVHIENQATAQTQFPKRMYRYSSWLMAQYNLPVYPVALLSYEKPAKEAPNVYEVKFEDLNVLRFEYRVIQLNRLSWRQYLDAVNPVALALLGKMGIPHEERVKVRLECMRKLVSLKLDPARAELVGSLIDQDMELTDEQMHEYESEIKALSSDEEQAIMELRTSWWKQGKQEGLSEGMRQIIVDLGEKRLGKPDNTTMAKLAKLTSADELRALAIRVVDAANWSELFQ
jgi:hypothetical protein